MYCKCSFILEKCASHYGLYEANFAISIPGVAVNYLMASAVVLCDAIVKLIATLTPNEARFTDLGEKVNSLLITIRPLVTLETDMLDTCPSTSPVKKLQPLLTSIDVFVKCAAI
jgi:hypothetical protein